MASTAGSSYDENEWEYEALDTSDGMLDPERDLEVIASSIWIKTSYLTVISLSNIFVHNRIAARK